MTEDIDVSKFWCWHEDCPDYRKIGAGNIVFKERYGKRNLALLKCKIRRNGHLAEVVKRVVFGAKEEVLNRLGVDSEDRIHTSYIERINLIIRNSSARFIRKTMNYSKKSENHSYAMDFFQAWYNFAKLHNSLKLEINQGNKRWYQRTPAMAEGLTENVWTIEEILNFRTPVQ